MGDNSPDIRCTVAMEDTAAAAVLDKCREMA